MMHNLTPSQYRECQDFEQLSSLEQFEIGVLYRTIFVGNGTGEGYDLLAKCVKIEQENISFTLVGCINQGNIANRDLPDPWSINGLNNISIFKIGQLKDYPEYIL